MVEPERTPAQKWVDSGDRQGLVDGWNESRAAGNREMSLQKADALVQIAIYDTLSQLLAVNREILAELRKPHLTPFSTPRELTKCERDGHTWAHQGGVGGSGWAKCSQCGAIFS